MEENNKKESLIKKLVINLLYMFLFLFLFMWIYPAPKLDLSEVKVDVDKTVFNSLLKGIFTNNIESMRIAAKDYYTIDRLPKNDGDSSYMTLDEMLNRKLLIPFVDEEGNACDLSKSYVKVTKNSSDYSLKINLVCNKQKDYIIDTIGCNKTCSSVNNSIINTTPKKEVVYLNNTASKVENNDKYKHVKTTQIIKEKTITVLDNNDNNNNIVINDYSKKPIWNTSNNYTCYVGNSNCNIIPSATDPYSGKSLSVKLYNGYVNTSVVGTYVITYDTYTEHGIYDSITVTVKVIKNNTISYKKYISNYHNSYYNDGSYVGYLNLDSNAGKISKYISDYYWTNRVKYTYRCTNYGGLGTEGWTYISTDTPYDHPTIYYSDYNYSGTLNKKGFYCKEACTEKLIPELGGCYNIGETKSIYRTWVGIYHGYVYSSVPNSYSGYVYLIN